MKATKEQIEELKKIIFEWLESEFDKEITDELDDIKNVPVAYTTNEPYYWQEDKYGWPVDVQGYVDIENFIFKREVLDLVFVELFDTFEKFKGFLKNADFGTYTAVDDFEWDQVFEGNPSYEPDWWEEYMIAEGNR